MRLHAAQIIFRQGAMRNKRSAELNLPLCASAIAPSTSLRDTRPESITNFLSCSSATCIHIVYTRKLELRKRRCDFTVDSLCYFCLTLMQLSVYVVVLNNAGVCVVELAILPSLSAEIVTLMPVPVSVHVPTFVADRVSVHSLPLDEWWLTNKYSLWAVCSRRRYDARICLHTRMRIVAIMSVSSRYFHNRVQ